jgi:hypothetical protein
MDLPAIIAKLTGAILLAWTARSIYRYFKQGKIKAVSAQSEPTTTGKDEKKTSFTEQLLNNFLLYLWLAFMLIFSTGMILNN